MPSSVIASKADQALAQSTTGTILVSQGPTANPATPATLAYDSGTQTLAIGAVAAASQVDHGTQTGTLSLPTPQTLWKHQPRNPAFARWELLSYGADFSGVWDPILYHGYNLNRDPANPGIDTEPTFSYNLEANYYIVSSGKYTAEAYVEFLSPESDGVSRFQRRPWAFTLDKATGSTQFSVDLGPTQAGWGQYTIVGGPAAGGSYTLFKVIAGAAATSSQTQILSPLLVVGNETLTSSDGAAFGTLVYGNDGNGNRYVRGNSATLQLGTTFTKLQFETAGTATLQSTAPTGTTAFILNAATSHATGALLVVQNAGTASFTVDTAGITTTGVVTATTGLKVGGGATITKILSASATLTFASIAAGAQQEQTISVTGATVGSPVSYGLPAAIEAGLTADAYVSAADTVKVRLTNTTGSPIVPAVATHKVIVFNP